MEILYLIEQQNLPQHLLFSVLQLSLFAVIPRITAFCNPAKFSSTHFTYLKTTVMDKTTKGRYGTKINVGR